MNDSLLRRLTWYAVGTCLCLWGLVTWMDPARLFGARGVPYARSEVPPAPSDAASRPASPPTAPARAPPPPLRLRGQPRAVLVVFAPASLSDALQDLGLAFRGRAEGAGVMFRFAAASWLESQLAAGAYCDLIASDGPAPLAALAREGLLGAPRVFASNLLTVLVPGAPGGRVTHLEDLATPGVRLALARPEVPVGGLAEQALGLLEDVGAVAPGFRAGALANVAGRETDADQVVVRIALGDADAGLAYASQATPRLRSQIRELPLPPAAAVTTRYAAAVTRASAHPELAAAFLDFLLSAEAASILASRGLGPAGPP